MGAALYKPAAVESRAKGTLPVSERPEGENCVLTLLSSVS